MHRSHGHLGVLCQVGLLYFGVTVILTLHFTHKPQSFRCTLQSGSAELQFLCCQISLLSRISQDLNQKLSTAGRVCFAMPLAPVQASQNYRFEYLQAPFSKTAESGRHFWMGNNCLFNFSQTLFPLRIFQTGRAHLYSNITRNISVLKITRRQLRALHERLATQPGGVLHPFCGKPDLIAGSD